MHIEQRMMLHIWFRGKLPWKKKKTRTEADDEMDEDDGKPEPEEEWRHLDNPIVVRFCVKDVVRIFVRVVYEGEGPLVVETVAAFGPRERVSGVVVLLFLFLLLVAQKSPHSQSDFKAFQTLSQQIANTIASCPTVSFQSFVVSPLDISYHSRLRDEV
jgi:hypothetical protein